jgi:hypothetical protein
MPTEVKFKPTHSFACFLTFARRFFAAFAIAALSRRRPYALLDATKGRLSETCFAAKAK